MTPEEQLQAIYDQIPPLDCKGLCQNACGPIAMSALERRRIEERGVVIPPYTLTAGASWRSGAQTHRCPALTRDGKCSVYDVRPYICRAWGAGRALMACEHGCRPEGSRLKARQLMDLLYQTFEVGGTPEGDSASPRDIQLYREMIKDDKIAALMARYVGGDFDIEGEMVLAMRAWGRERELIR